MTRTVSATEAKAKLSAIMKWAVKNKDGVIVENRGKPRVVIIPFEEYERLEEIKEQERREKALARLEEIAAEVRARNPDLNAEEAEQLADQVTRETIERMADEGKVTFKKS